MVAMVVSSTLQIRICENPRGGGNLISSAFVQTMMVTMFGFSVVQSFMNSSGDIFTLTSMRIIVYKNAFNNQHFAKDSIYNKSHFLII
jgi:hypothetical protein